MRTYDLEYLKRCGKASPLQGIKEAGKTWGYVPLKKRIHWCWKLCEVFGRHRLYRHQNVPHNGYLDDASLYHVPTGAIKRVSEATGKHVRQDDSPQSTVDFYTRNAVSGKAKRKRASLRQNGATWKEHWESRARMSHAKQTVAVCQAAMRA